MSILLVALVSFVVAETIGYGIHLWAHYRSSGPLYKVHLIHHFVFYPPARYTTEKYKGGLSNSFVPLFIPGFLAIAAGSYYLLPFHLFLVSLGTISLVSWWNSWLHDTFHIEGHWLKRYGWHRRLTDLHLQHHKKVLTNLGIYLFTIDRIRGSFRE